MVRKIKFISMFALLKLLGSVNAGTNGSEDLKGSSSDTTANECFEGFSRAMF